jgi:hypothetical protein
VKVAAAAFWMYVVQREALGLIDSEYLRGSMEFRWMSGGELGQGERQSLRLSISL